MANDISARFNEICPGNALDPNHFSIISGLFREAVAGQGQRLDLSHDASDHETTSPRSGVEREMLISEQGFLTAVSETIAPDHPQNDKSASPVHNLQHHQDSRLLVAGIAKLPPYREAVSLTDVFFTYLESNWYYFDEGWFRGLLVQVYREEPLAPQIHCTTLCLVFLVLALGESFLHVNQSSPADLRQQDLALDELPGIHFYQVAMELMPSVLSTTTVESVQCCLLKALYTLPTQNSSYFYTYSGLALRLAVSLSLHLNTTDNKVTPESREVSTRVFWTAYCIERRSSVVMGFPTMLQMKDITAPLPQKRPDLDKLRPQKVDRLIAFTKLTLVLNKVTDASPVDENSDKFSWACSTLEGWKQSLPAHLVALDTLSLRATAHLDIMYQIIWIYIGRAALLRLVRKRLRQSDGGGKSDLSTTEKLADKCVNAAHSIIEWIDLLSSHNKLAKFSWTDFHSCSSAIIVILLNEVLRTRDLSSSTIDHGIDALRFMASGSRLARDGLHLVERLRASVRKHKASGQNGPTLVARNDNAAAEVPGISLTQDTGAEYTPSDFSNFDPALFSDLEPSLLQYSSQDLSLFGFDGFFPTDEADGSLWSWDDPMNPALPW
ncbi:hypothetical protein H2204_001804 [Knufia peltigerae]|uniref:Xylanolytic transcriptional activator regulatory domain-containing protein n=1 Tax=Knufia peltigerae TaxID=1002370 RepID=A0AA39D3D7_9EURO|nr:hypothetical protein H2204_001804 [Knufia peltigerae]